MDFYIVFVSVDPYCMGAEPWFGDTRVFNDQSVARAYYDDTIKNSLLGFDTLENFIALCKCEFVNGKMVITEIMEAKNIEVVKYYFRREGYGKSDAL